MLSWLKKLLNKKSPGPIYSQREPGNTFDIDDFNRAFNQGSWQSLPKEHAFLALQNYLEFSNLNFARILLEQGTEFNDYTFVNLIRDGKYASVNLLLEFFENLKIQGPHNFINSSLALALIDDNTDLFKSLIAKGISHDGLLYNICESDNVWALVYYLGGTSIELKKPTAHQNIDKVLAFFQNNHSNLHALKQRILRGNQKSFEFLSFLLINQPSLYFEIDMDFIWPKLSLEIKQALLTEVKNQFKIDLSIEIQGLSGLNKNIWPTDDKDLSNLSPFLEKIYGEKLHRPFVRKISSEISQGNFRWINCIYWARIVKEKIPQDLLFNLDCFVINKESEKYSHRQVEEREQKITFVFDCIQQRTTSKKLHKILSSFESQSFYLTDMFYYMNDVFFREIQALEGSSFREVHDQLGMIMLKNKHKNFNIGQDDLNSALDQKSIPNQKAKILVPTQSDDLLKLGNDLKICVGTAGYGRRCLDGDIFIVILELIDAKKDNFICVEYKRKEYRIIQARSFHNKAQENTSVVNSAEKIITDYLIEKEKKRFTSR